MRLCVIEGISLKLVVLLHPVLELAHLAPHFSGCLKNRYGKVENETEETVKDDCPDNKFEHTVKLRESAKKEIVKRALMPCFLFGSNTSLLYICTGKRQNRRERNRSLLYFS